MATDQDILHSVDSEEALDIECFNCSQSGQTTPADHYCLECGDNLCGGCLRAHNKIARLSSHHILGAPRDPTKGALVPPTDTCPTHLGKLVEMYCGTHAVACCTVCISQDHKSCTDTNYIPLLAAGISESQELTDTKDALTAAKADLHNIRELKEARLDEILKERDKALTSTTMYRDKLIDRINKLAETTRREIMNTSKKNETEIKADLEDIAKTIKTLEHSFDEIDASMKDETKLFIHLKHCNQIRQEHETLVENMKASLEENIVFEIDNSLKGFLDTLQLFGNFVKEDQPYSTVCLHKPNIRSSSDDNTCRITGLCQLPNGDLVAVDCNNNSIKKLSQSYKCTDQLVLNSTAWDICETGPKEVAVTMLHEKAIQFVHVDQKMVLTKSIQMTGNGLCVGLLCSDDKLYVSREVTGRPGYVQVYGKAGELLKTVTKDQNGETIFSQPLHIAASICFSNIYITDYSNGIVILNKASEFVQTIKDPDINVAYGICVCPDGQLIVCGRHSNNLVQFRPDGQKIGVVEVGGEILRYPEMLHLDQENLKLTVTMNDSNQLQVLSLVRRQQT